MEKTRWVARCACVLLAVLVATSRPISGHPGPHYHIRFTKTFVTRGTVKAASCANKCVEGHDCTTCVGARVWDNTGAIRATEVYDKYPCCLNNGGCGVNFHVSACNFPGENCPANGCPSATGPFTVNFRPLLRTCVGAGGSVVVPSYVARPGNLVNNNPVCGSACNGNNFFDLYPANQRTDDSFTGGYTVSCPGGGPNVQCIEVTFDECHNKPSR